MPKIDSQLVLNATNKALAELDPTFRLPSLDSDKNSIATWSCNNFAPATLQYVLEESKGKAEDPKQYQRDAERWPSNFSEPCFVNFSLAFKNSSSNHNFNVYFAKGGLSYLIQAYLNHSIRISSQIRTDQFIRFWKGLIFDDWANYYQGLFYVKPETKDNGYESQWVTVVTAP